MSTIIANPIYDSVFKYLMEDQRAAKIILSDLLQRDVLEVNMKSNEYTQKIEGNITVLRIDFGAKIRDVNGNIENVNIELQKSWLTSEIIRFRKHLSSQYAAEDNKFIISDKPLTEKHLHIIAIYLLGHEVKGLENAVTYIYPKMYDQFGSFIQQDVKNVDFVNELIHDMIVIQIPKISKSNVKSRLDKLLSLFDQTYRWGNDHQLKVEESDYVDDHKYVFNRLLHAQVDEEVRKGMDVEDEYQTVIDKMEQEIAFKDEQLANKDEQLAGKDKQLSNLINLLVESGTNIHDVSESLNIPIERVKELLKQ